jgi:glycosyltransferase involved in cell wall biosynthesis
MVALNERGHEICQVWRPRDGIRGELVAGWDLLHVYRAHEDEVVQIARTAKQRGIAVVYDNDDDMRSVPRNNVAFQDYGGFAGDRALRQIRRLVQLADLTTAPSTLVVDRFREYGAKHAQVLENYVSDAALDASAPPHGDRVVAGWLAGSEHHLDVERLPLREAFGRLLDAYPQLTVETIGVGLGVRHERYRHVQNVEFFDLPPKLAEWDIGLAPIADIPFNRGRSSIKVKEYAALGRPWLASPVGPYVGLGEQEGGRLVPDDRWFEELGRLLDKPRERRKLAKRARRWGRAQAISANVKLWEDALSAAIVRSGGTVRPAGRPHAVAIARAPV